MSSKSCWRYSFFFFQAEDGIRDLIVTGVQTCALPIFCPQLAHAELWTRCDGRSIIPHGQVADRQGNHMPARPMVLRPGSALSDGVPGEIGRASCRERVENSGAAGAFKE